MSVEALGWAMSQTVGNPTQKLILLGLANHARKDGSAAFPSVKTLAEYAEVGERQVQRHLRALESAGWIAPVADPPIELSGWRPDRRPAAYDLVAMARGDARVIPLFDGVTPEAPRGDVAMTPEPSITTHVSPLPTEGVALVLDALKSDDLTGLEVWVDPTTGKQARRVDRLWDAACGIWGRPATKSEHGRRNREIAELRTARVSPDELVFLFTKAVTRWRGEARPGLAGIVRNVGDLRDGVEVSPDQVDEYQSEVRQQQRLLRAAELDQKGLPS